MEKIRKNIILAAVMLLFSAPSVFGQEYHTILIVFDASVRMAEEIDGVSKFTHGINFVEKLTNAKIPALFALTVFGSEEAGGSEAYFSPVPPGMNTGPAIIKELKQLKPEGMSPIASAIAYGCQPLPVNGNNYIILITDGVENAGGGPISITESLMQRGLITRLDVVGFTGHVEENPLITGLVKAGDGMYVPAWRADALIEKYFTMTTANIERSRTGMAGYRCFIGRENGFPAYGSTVELLSSAGKLIESRKFWRGIFENLPEGRYILTAKQGSNAPQSRTITVTAGLRIEENFVFNIEAGGFTFEHLIKNTANGKAYGTVTKVYHSSGEIVYTGISWTGEVTNLPEGKYKVEGYFEGLPPQTQEVTVTSSTTPKLTFYFDAGKGRISYKCFLDPSKTKVANGTLIRIYRQPYNEQVVEQTQWRGTTPYLSIGPYTVEGNYKGIIRKENVEVHADSILDLNFIFNIQNVRFSYQCFRDEQKRTPANGVNFQILNQKGFLIEESSRWRGTFSLPEGVYTLRAQFEGKTKIQTLHLFASSEQNMVVFDFSK